MYCPERDGTVHLSRFVGMNPAGLPEQRSHHQCRNQNTHPEETGVPEMRARVDGLCAQSFAEALSKNRPDRCGDAEGQEIDCTGRTPLDLVGINLLDDGVRDHGSPGSHTEDEQREPCGKEGRGVNQLGEADQHDRRAP